MRLFIAGRDRGKKGRKKGRKKKEENFRKEKNKQTNKQKNEKEKKSEENQKKRILPMRRRSEVGGREELEVLTQRSECERWCIFFQAF